MRSVRSFVALGIAGAMLVLSILVTPALAGASTRHRLHVLLDGLSSPKGLAIASDGNAVIAQGAFGPPGPVLVHFLRGPDRGETIEVTEPLGLVDVALSPLDDTGWGIRGEDGVLLHELADGTIVEVLDIHAYQAGDPDPVDQEGGPFESNPYGLTVMRNGDALVADAAGNDLIRVTPDGVATTIARFDVETISLDHLTPEQRAEFGLPPELTELTAEAVPTSVTIGRDGFIYVGELKGFPFRPGSSHVWRIDPDSEGVLCSVNTPDADCKVAASGLTAIQDIAINRRGGAMYVYELAADGVLAFEAGLETGDFPPAVLLEIRHNRETELLAGELTQPGGVAVSRNGTLLVTDSVFTEGGGRLIRVS
jgi:hypothetical protein